MDRIIKFRGKIKDKKRAKELNLKVGDWVYGYYFHDEGLELVNGKSKEFDRHYIINTPYFEEFIEVIPETIGQFTGLYDIEKNEIYNNDIVSEQDHFVNSDRLIYQKIQWKETYSCWLRGEYQRLTPKNIERYKIKVVGNIYDNKKLEFYDYLLKNGGGYYTEIDDRNNINIWDVIRLLAIFRKQYLHSKMVHSQK